MSKVLITPEMAKRMLEKNGHNRKVSTANVSKITNAMKVNKWAYNGEPIIIGEDGTLLDGQHRLLGIIKADKEIHMEVVKDVKEICEYTGVNVFATIDVGKNRSAADVISIQDKSVKALDIVKMIRAKRVVDTKTITQSTTGGGYNKSNEAILENYIAHSTELQELLIDAAALKKDCQYSYMSIYDFAVIRYATRKEDTAKAEMFLHILSAYSPELLEDGEECGEQNKNLCRVIKSFYSKLSSLYEQVGGGAAFQKLKLIGMFKVYHYYVENIETGLSITKTMELVYPKSLKQNTISTINNSVI